MVRQDSDSMHGGTCGFLGTGEAPSEEGVETPGGFQEKPSLDRSLGDFDHGPGVGEITQSSSHNADKDAKRSGYRPSAFNLFEKSR
ncbi:MAG: hypothetical protein AAGF23_07145 [Acidobacteriota bacterium]